MDARSASCLLAVDASPEELARAVALHEAASLSPIVAVVAAGAPVPAPARAVIVSSRRPDANTPLRFGLTQLLNAEVTGALVMDARAVVPLAAVLAVLDAATRDRPLLVRGGDDDALLWAHRDVWRELLTSAAVDEVAARHRVVRVPPPAPGLP